MRRARPLQATALALLLAGGCATGRGSAGPIAPIAEDERGIVVFVPGITGSELKDRETGRVLWGDLRSFFLPRDDGYGIAVPIGGASDRLDAGSPLLRIGTLPLLRREIYLPIVETLEAAGYRRGDDLVLFGYDWRRDSVGNARLLARRIESLGEAGGPERPEVHLVCQSNAAYLCRWAVRFGDVSLEEAGAGRRTPVSHARIASVTLLASANGGGIRTLREIDRGRRYVKGVGRSFRPELFFTCESLYQDLPSGRADLFVDENGKPLDIDLFDAATWKRYGWSIFGRDAARRAARAPEIFADEATQLTRLQGWLDRAKRLHARLRDDSAPWPEGTRLVSIQSRSHPTMTRAVVMRQGEGWKTLFLGDRELDGRTALESLLSEEGDIHASVSSQQTLNASELKALGNAVFYVSGDHLTVMHQEETMRLLRETIGGSN